MAPVLGGLLAEYLQRHKLPVQANGGVMVPVPLHARRLRSRGYNQSNLLAMEAGKLLGIPVREDLLKRANDSPPQVEARTREHRRANVAGNFQASAGVAGMSVLFSLISIYIVLSWFPFTPSIKKSYLERGKPRRENVTHLYRQYGPKAAPVLSQHPLFSILNGKRPLIGDHFNLTVLRKKFPEIREDYTNKIRGQYFGSIVLQNWPPIFEKDIESVDDPHFKEKAEAFHESQRVDDFYDLFLEYYEIASVQRPFVYYLPKDLSQAAH